MGSGCDSAFSRRLAVTVVIPSARPSAWGPLGRSGTLATRAARDSASPVPRRSTLARSSSPAWFLSGEWPVAEEGLLLRVVPAEPGEWDGVGFGKGLVRLGRRWDQRRVNYKGMLRDIRVTVAWKLSES